MMSSTGTPASCTSSRPLDSLYNIAVNAVITSYSTTKSSVRYLSSAVQFDIYEKLFRDGRLCTLGYEFCELDVFLNVLSVGSKRFELHGIFQALIDHGLQLPKILANEFCQNNAAFIRRWDQIIRNIVNYDNVDRKFFGLVSQGLNLGSFLIEAGWYNDGAKCIESSLELCQHYPDQGSLRLKRLIIEAYVCLLEAYNGYCRYDDAQRIFHESLRYVDRIQEGRGSFCFAELYSQYCSLFFIISSYEEAHDWALKSLRELSSANRPDDWKPYVKTIIRVFSQATKILVVRRQFRKAELLIKYAVTLTCRYYDGGKRYPATLLDYGFYLLNTDLNEAAVQMCQLGLDYCQAQFGGKNLKLAQAHEDLGYALYVMEYNTGHFTAANEHANRAIFILKTLLPSNHLLLASCQRVKGLILEEIAIDSQDKSYEATLLREAEELQMAALSVCKRMFGENNIQTAKYYGNLGRLYQSLRRYNEAEEMHLKAIGIKEGLLGSDDYEVAISMGHLASLYTYDMHRLDDAERLYLRCVEIGMRLFGDSYSGLEYDYRGLMSIYAQLDDREKVTYYSNALHNWRVSRDNNENRLDPLSIMNVEESTELEDVQLILRQFFEQDQL